MSKSIYIATDGREVHLRPVSHILLQRLDIIVEKEFREAGRQVDPPQYRAELAGGGEEFHDHDEKSIEGAPNDEKEAWENYLTTQAELGDETSSRRGLFMFRKGIRFEETDYSDDDWAEEQKLWGFDVPDDPDKRLNGPRLAVGPQAILNGVDPSHGHHELRLFDPIEAEGARVLQVRLDVAIRGIHSASALVVQDGLA